MSEEDIFDYLQTTSLEPHDDYTSEITYKDQKIIWNRLKEKNKEIERLNNIIKEVKEYLNKNAIEEVYLDCKLYETEVYKDILEILDNEEDNDSPYCEVCGHCGEIECCGIRDFIEHHIKGKTNCKNEQDIIYELIDLCDYKDEVFKENEKLKKELEELEESANDSITWWQNRFNAVERDKIRLNNIINELERYINEEYIYDELGMKIFDASELQDKLQELKGSDKE